ncbi:MAG: non-canonical purine NTP pyrophosphatase, RdgB/HAM1 family [Pseudooceanicola sp.]|nr:non-canonical purine NTP pyrophosphatase, RdgB/HAM1 family [Pseudooceanicola sp.]
MSWYRCKKPPVRRFDGNKLVIASHNAGKLREIAALLAPFGINVSSAADHGLEEPEETEDTFVGNARIKAHFAARTTGLPALSDDSGIMVEALDGQPGVYTADWAETPDGRDFPMAMTKVWTMLEEKSATLPRKAAFNATLVLAWPDGHDEVFEGRVEGEVVWPTRGDKGFGFDPMFLPAGETETFGEMDPNRKHEMSHRADAFRKLVTGCFA